jgi:ESX secretion system protein EccD
VVAVHQAVESRERTEPDPADGGLRRVAVYFDSGRVDLVLSAAVPLESLIPPIVDIVATEHGPSAQPEALRYQLSLPGNAALDPSKTLSELGLQDGSAMVLTTASTVLTPPRFDDPAEAVSASIEASARPWTRRAARLIGALAASWLAGTGAVVLLRSAFDHGDAYRGGSVGVAAATAFTALSAAAVADRMFRDWAAGLTLGVVACGFAALVGLLAVPGTPGGPNALLAMAAAASLAIAIRLIGCSTTFFTALACFTAVGAVAAMVNAVTAVPLRAIGAATAAISLVLIEASVRASIALARLTSEPNPANVIRASVWLNGMIPAFSAAAALGAIGTTVERSAAGGSRLLCIGFAILTGVVLLLRARLHRDLAKSVPLVVAGIATLSATFVIAAAAYPLCAPYLAATSTTLAAVALWLGFLAQPTAWSPIGRRSIDMLEYLALAVIVPLACWICGVYGAVRGMKLP